MKYRRYFYIVIIFCFLVAGCGTQSVINENISLVELLSQGSDIEEIHEISEVGNCCGVVEHKSINCQSGLDKSISLSGGFSEKISAELESQLGFINESGESLQLDIPPAGYVYKYPITRSYSTVSGDALVKSFWGTEKKIQYRYITSCSLNIDYPIEIAECNRNCVVARITITPENSNENQIYPTEIPNSGVNPTITPTELSFSDDLINSFAKEELGSGIFSTVFSSDGNLPYSQSNLDRYHFQIFRIRREENPSGCGKAGLDSDYIWFSGAKGTTLSINNKEMGTLYTDSGSHGFLIKYSVKASDTMCAIGYSSSGFHIIGGPDVIYQYGSYCYRGNCK